MSRPSSRLSVQGQSSDQQHHTRTGTSTGSTNVGSNHSRRSASSVSLSSTLPARPHSALSNIASSAHAPMPFTPGMNSKTSRLAHLGLSAKQVDKLSESIANIQRGPQTSSTHAPGNVFHSQSSKATTIPSRRLGEEANRPQDRKGKARALPNASFIAETSFADAPLNSRLVNNNASPRKERITTKRLRQIITNTGDEDDEADLQQLDDQSISDGEDDEPPKEDLNHADLSIQEALLIEDLLSVLIGIEGQFITMESAMEGEEIRGEFEGSQFYIDDHIDESLRDLTRKILSLATYYTAIQAFIETYSHLNFGLTSHALCSGIRDTVKDYHILIARLEEHFECSPTFSLQKFYYFVQPTLHRTFLIYELLQDLTTSPAEGDVSAGEGSGALPEEDDDSDDDDRFGGGKAMKEALKQMSAGTDQKSKPLGWAAGGPVKGGEILTIIEERLQRTSGDPDALELYSNLLLKASQPYAQTLLRWVTTGHLTDPHDEFMIKELKSLHCAVLDQDYVDEYWERKYTLKDLSMGNSSSVGIASSQDTDKALLDPLAKGISSDRQELVSSDSRAMKREKGLGGGAVIPAFLESWKVKVLLAGKYLNVIRECGVNDLLQGDPNDNKAAMSTSGTNVDMTSEEFQTQLDEAYFSANKALLTLLLERQELFPRLRSLKHHFFLDHGDSFTNFLDLASHELSKKSKHVSLSKLQSLLDLAIRNPSSASSGDPYKEDVKVALSGSTLHEWLMKIASVSGTFPDETGDGLPDSAGPGSAGESKERDSGKKKDDKSVLTGMDALSLDYTVNFPLSLVISRKAILRYQLIFRHLLALKHLEQTLTSNWLEHIKNPVWRKKTPHVALEKWKSRVFTLRGRMLAFAQQMFGFAVSEVLEGNWRQLMNKLEKVETVDQLLKYHIDFLDTCLKECMLTNPKLLRLQSKLMTTCALFISYNSKLTKAATSLTNATEHALDQGEDWTSVSIKSEDDFLQKFEVNFYRHQKIHSDTVTFHALSDTGSLLALVVRLVNTVPESEGPP